MDASDTGSAPVDVEITGGADGQKVGRKPSVADKGDGLHAVTYVPPLVGEPYEVCINRILHRKRSCQHEINLSCDWP